MDQHSENRLTLVFPRLADKIRRLNEELETTEKFSIVVVQGLRTIAEQQELYEQGRSKPGPKVTNAPGGYSWHNFGLAVDVAPIGPDDKIDWNPAHPTWKLIIDVGTSIGLTSGIHWGDAPHFQLTGRFPVNAPTDEVRKLWAQGPTVLWAEVERTM